MIDGILSPMPSYVCVLCESKSPTIMRDRCLCTASQEHSDRYAEMQTFQRCACN